MLRHRLIKPFWLKRLFRCCAHVEPEFCENMSPESSDTQAAPQGGDTTKVVYGGRTLTALKNTFLYAQKVGMKAACVCEFYMT